MNKKDIAHMRRQFRVNNDKLEIKEIFNVYIMKESSEVYHQQCLAFELLEDEQKELFMINFKKVLSGNLDEKLFELKFKRDAENSSQLILHHGLISQDTEQWTSQMLQIVEKMLKDKQYEMDVVITFIRGEYRKPMKRQSEEVEGSNQDTVYSHPFILCSMNRTEDPKKELLFDYVEKEFKYNVVVDPIIDLKAPITGFLFPSITDHASDVNHILYSTGKSNELNEDFIEDVINAEEIMTAQDDKDAFEEIVRSVAGDQMNTRTLSNVYDEVNRIMEENEEEEVPKLDYRDVERVLTSSGIEKVDQDKVEVAFKSVIDDEKYELKANNIVPKYTSKSIKIKTKIADISISPQDLRYVRQVHVNGKQCLLIEVEETTKIEGFDMIPEVLFEKADDLGE